MFAYAHVERERGREARDPCGMLRGRQSGSVLELLIQGINNLLKNVMFHSVKYFVPRGNATFPELLFIPMTVITFVI